MGVQIECYTGHMKIFPRPIGINAKKYDKNATLIPITKTIYQGYYKFTSYTSCYDVSQSRRDVNLASFVHTK